MALQTSADSPAPLRQVSTLIGDWVGRLGAVWVEAEVASLNRRPGTCFLILRDLRATLSVQATCHVSIIDAAPSPITPGARVIVHARPTFYEPTGALSLELREIRPAGEGELLAQLERRRQLLAAEGLFDPRLKRPLPVLPRAIGLITGRDSDAEKDVIRNARLRWPAVPFVVRHALMQGAESARAVVTALRELEAGGDVDVIVIARGGGSVESLLPFSDEALIRAVHACAVPVVSAIGHEADSPILDLVADVRASTPTDAAKRVVPDVVAELAGVAGFRERARLAVHSWIDRERRHLAQTRSRPVLARPTTLIDAQRAIVEDTLARARHDLRHRLDRERDAVGHHLARVQALSPLATLRRGYAVAQHPDGSVISGLDQVPAEFAVRLADGSVHVRTLRTDPSDTGRTEETPHG